MKTALMKLNVKRWLLVFCLFWAAVNANGQIIYEHPVSSDVIIRDLNTLMDKFCRYVEIIGSTKHYNTPKVAQVRDSVPKLFYEYDSCYMLTTYADKGRKQDRKTMKRYFRNLETQAAGGLNRSVTYDLNFELICSGDGFKWKKDTSKKFRNGAELYSAEVLILQRYIREGGTGGDNSSRRIEEDHKTMKVWKIIMDNRTIVSLGSVERIERIDTQGR